MNEELNRANEHVWRYFELHAQQRMTVFNFYIAITGLLAAGVGFTLQQGEKYAFFTSVMGIFIFFISFIFWKLDQRVSILIKNAELALQELETQFANAKLRIISKDSDYNMLNSGIRSIWTYGKCFRISFAIVGISGLILAIIPFVLRVSGS
ncbi:hypothetical protein ACV1FH_21785 [Klebsiella pneumoniae]|nr:hypothetical protein [Klebsiella pneumoniae]